MDDALKRLDPHPAQFQSTDSPTRMSAAEPESQLRMFAQPTGRRLFGRAPQSVAEFVAALLEPTLCAIVLVVAQLVYETPFTRASMTLLLLAQTLTFPGHDRFHDRPLSAAVDIVMSWCGVVSMLLLCGYLTDSLDLFDWPMLAAWATATPIVHWLAVMVGRELLLRRAQAPSTARRAVIVGAGSLAVRAAAALRSRGDARTTVLGFFDDRGGDRLDNAAAPQRLGDLAALATYLGAHSVHEVYITLPLGSQPRIIKLLESLQGSTASVYLVPDVFGISVIQGRLHDLNGLAIVGLCETPFTGMNEAIKRCSDIVLAALIIAVTSPLLLTIAIGVKLSSPGPVLFKQRRNGLGGEEIVVYKFRSMRTMEDGQVVRQATRGDTRITRFGAFLRRTSLDELPQFINVLQGRMSVVGPRPHAVAHNETYRQLIRAYMVRHKVRPGITGWAQVNGHRGETDTVEKMRARVEYDLEYLRNWSLALDLQIVAKTIKLIVADRHAY